MEQRYGTDPSRRYGTGVWNGGMERVWSRSLFRTSYFDLHPYDYIWLVALTILKNDGVHQLGWFPIYGKSQNSMVPVSTNQVWSWSSMTAFGATPHASSNSAFAGFSFALPQRIADSRSHHSLPWGIFARSHCLVRSWLVSPYVAYPIWVITPP